MPLLDESTKLVFSDTYSKREDRFFRENFGLIDVIFEYNKDGKIDYEKS